VKVALDGTPLIVSTGGIPRYASELSLALRQTFPEDEFFLLTDQPVLHEACLPPGPLNPFERRWWSIGLPRRLAQLSVDVFHGTDYAVPYIPLRPAVLSLHDLSPWLNPGWHNAAGRVRRRAPYLMGLGLATLVMTPTEAVRRGAIDLFGLSPSRVVAVPYAAPSWMRPSPQQPPPRPYFLYVGTLEPRKNIPVILEAWRHVRRVRDVDLVLAGRRREDFPPLDPEPGLILRGTVPDSELPPLYSNCVACLYPSLYEGFGLPVLEAMQCGAAVVTSRDPAVREVAGDAALYAGDGDWPQALTALLDQPELLSRLREQSLRRAALFSWRGTAIATRQVYALAMSGLHT